MDTAQIVLVVGIVSLIASDVIWEASLTNAGYLVLKNAGSDSAHKLRAKFWVMTRREPGDLGPMPFGLRSDNAFDLEKFSGIYSHKKSKALMAPGQAMGLPIPPTLPQSPYRCGTTGERFGLRLQLEWFTHHGNHKTETMCGEDVGVVFSGYVFPDIETLPVAHYSTTPAGR